MGDVTQVLEWVRGNCRQVAAAILFATGGVLGLLVANYVIREVGSESPELALSYDIMRFGTFVLFGLLAASLASGKAGAR